MGWNGSTSNIKSYPTKQKNCKCLRVGITLLMLTILAFLCYLLIKRSENQHEIQQNRPEKRIREVQPQIAEPSPAIVEEPEYKSVSSARPPKPVITKDANGQIFIDGKPLPKSHRKERPRPPYAIFDHESENRIAALISIEPGTRLFGTIRFDDRFKKDFEESCKHPIVIRNDDSDYVKSLKKDMIQTKIELANRISNGEDLCTIIHETRQELQKMGVLKREVEDLIRKNINSESAISDISDIDIMIDTANRMLAEKGIAPLRMNPVLKQNLARTVFRRINHE